MTRWQITGGAEADRVQLNIVAENAGRVVGRRGATLGAIRLLLTDPEAAPGGGLGLGRHAHSLAPRQLPQLLWPK